jgi:hypothetical protein
VPVLRTGNSFIELTEEEIAMVTGGGSAHIDTTTMTIKTSNPDNIFNGAINVFIDGDKIHIPQH